MDGVSHGRDYVMMVVCIYGGIVASGICSTEKSYRCHLVLYTCLCASALGAWFVVASGRRCGCRWWNFRGLGCFVVTMSFFYRPCLSLRWLCRGGEKTGRLGLGKECVIRWVYVLAGPRGCGFLHIYTYIP